jgi:MFS family permease
LVTLLLVGAAFAIGNGLSTPALTGLASKSVGRGEQGGVLGITQSVASLARTVGPVISAALIYSGVVTLGADKLPHYMSDHSLRLTFWSASVIMFGAFMLAIHFVRSHAAEYKTTDVAPANS